MFHCYQRATGACMKVVAVHGLRENAGAAVEESLACGGIIGSIAFAWLEGGVLVS